MRLFDLVARESAALHSHYKELAVKIAVFAGDLFWSASPYEQLNLAHYMGRECETDLVMFEKDIRLVKSFRGDEKYRFDRRLFTEFPRLRTISSWKDLETVSRDYSAVLANCKIAPKTRTPDLLSRKGALQSPIVSLDVGGTDQLTDCPYADFAVSKSQVWAENVSGMWGIPAIPLGCHQYDYYMKDDIPYGSRLPRDVFEEKYGVNSFRTLLIAPTNPNSHLDMYRIGMDFLEAVCRKFSDAGYSLLIKTYPHDYLFHEREAPLSGVYRRASPHTDGLPQYEYLSKKFGLRVVESQDHHAAVTWCRFLYNMSGSHIGWETHFTECRSFSVGYGKQGFFGSVPARGKRYAVPDQHTTLDLTCVDDLPEVKPRSDEDKRETSRFMPSKPLVNDLRELVDWLKSVT